ncbi:MAG TPA: hypothetical protein VF254_01530 [Gammaproteobacteria bacterium]
MSTGALPARRRIANFAAARILAMFAVILFAPGCIADEPTAEKPATSSRTETPNSNCAARADDPKPENGRLKAGRIRPDKLIVPPRPEKGESFRDPHYGACIVRLTDHRNEPPAGFIRNYYSRFQPFNADESRILLIAQDGMWHLYDAKTFEYLKPLDLGGGSVEPRWHPSDPDILYVLPEGGGLSMHAYDVETGERVRIADFTDLESIAGDDDAGDIRKVWPKAARIWTRWEGSPSRDGRYWAFQVETEDGEPLGLITFDLAAQRILGTYDIRDIGRPDHISMSPKGNYAVASWPRDAADCPLFRDKGTLEKPCGLMAFSLDFEEATALAEGSPHSDIAIDADGREVIVISNYDSGNVEMIDLASGKITPLWRIYIDGASTALHVSGKAYRKPGWVLVSTYWTKDPNDAHPWYENKLMAVELKADPRILNIANIVTRSRSYFTEPHATVNRDFTRVVFNANWGTGKEEDIDAYIALLPPDAVPAAQ